MFIEPLNQAIRQNVKIKCINMRDGEHKSALFADNMLIYLTHPMQSFPKFMELFEEYGDFSGYKLNIHMTQTITFNYSPPISRVRKYNFKLD